MSEASDKAKTEETEKPNPDPQCIEGMEKVVKRVLPDEEEQELGEEEEKEDKEELLPLPSRETLMEAEEKNDGSLGQALLTCLGSEDRMTDPQFKVFEDTYGRALNKAPCPCGSDNIFRDCCKQPWRMMNRSYEKEAKRQHKVKKQIKKHIEQMSQVKPVITIGIKPDGTIDYQKPKGAPDKLSLSDLVDILQKAWAQAYMHLTIQAAKEIIAKEYGENKPTGPLPGM